MRASGTTYPTIGAAVKKFTACDDGNERLCRTPKSGLLSTISTEGRVRLTIGFSTLDDSWSEHAMATASTRTPRRPRRPRSRKTTPTSARSGILKTPGLERARMIGSSQD